jgi:hypothetical protein
MGVRGRFRGRADDKGARLTELAAFLYAESGRYWFFAQPILNRLAEDCARAYQDHEVDDKIVEMLAADAKTQGRFSRVSPPMRDPTTIDEAPNLALVILGPAFPHSGRRWARAWPLTRRPTCSPDVARRSPNTATGFCSWPVTKRSLRPLAERCAGRWPRPRVGDARTVQQSFE